MLSHTVVKTYRRRRHGSLCALAKTKEALLDMEAPETLQDVGRLKMRRLKLGKFRVRGLIGVWRGSLAPLRGGGGGWLASVEWRSCQNKLS